MLRLLGHTLIAPRAHREQVTTDFKIEEYLALQHLVYRVGEAIRQELSTERLYIMSVGSQSGNRHVQQEQRASPSMGDACSRLKP